MLSRPSIAATTPGGALLPRARRVLKHWLRDAAARFLPTPLRFRLGHSLRPLAPHALSNVLGTWKCGRRAKHLKQREPVVLKKLPLLYEVPYFSRQRKPSFPASKQATAPTENVRGKSRRYRWWHRHKTRVATQVTAMSIKDLQARSVKCHSRLPLSATVTSSIHALSHSFQRHYAIAPIPQTNLWGTQSARRPTFQQNMRWPRYSQPCLCLEPVHVVLPT